MKLYTVTIAAMMVLGLAACSKVTPAERAAREAKTHNPGESGQYQTRCISGFKFVINRYDPYAPATQIMDGVGKGVPCE